MKSRALLIVALEQELPTISLADFAILYAGVGKVNAAINLMAALTEKTQTCCSITAQREQSKLA